MFLQNIYQILYISGFASNSKKTRMALTKSYSKNYRMERSIKNHTSQNLKQSKFYMELKEKIQHSIQLIQQYEQYANLWDGGFSKNKKKNKKFFKQAAHSYLNRKKKKFKKNLEKSTQKSENFNPVIMPHKKIKKNFR